MKAVARDDHDLVARSEVGTEDRTAALGDDPDRAAGELYVVGRDQPGQRRRLAASPGGAGVDARLSPAGEQPAVAVLVRVPVGRSGREVGVHDQRHRADAAQIVDDRRHRVVRDVVERAQAELLLYLSRDDRLGPESLDHERERLPAGLEHERGLASRLVHSPAAGRGQQPGRRERLGQRVALAGVERVVVDPGRTVSGAPWRSRVGHADSSSVFAGGQFAPARPMLSPCAFA